MHISEVKLSELAVFSLETDYPSVNIDWKSVYKVRWIVHPKLRLFLFQIKTTIICLMWILQWKTCFRWIIVSSMKWPLSDNTNIENLFLTLNSLYKSWFNKHSLAKSWRKIPSCLQRFNRAFARWRNFTTTTRILQNFVFWSTLGLLLFKPRFDNWI